MKYKVLSEIKKYKKTLPSLAELEQVGGEIKQVPNKRGEYKRKIHYGCFLLCSQSGLRISEAVKFDLNAKTRKGLYRISKCKGNKNRYIYVSKEVVRELKKNNWKPHQTNRFAFYHFLQKTKKELGISQNVELTPHTFRRAFTTYHANSGMPLPLLQKLLGHSSIRTTALYWQNIYGEDDENDDTADILAGKKWLETKPDSSLPEKENREKEPPKSPPAENFPKTAEKSEPIIKDKPIITTEKPVRQDNLLLTTEQEKNPVITNYRLKSVISEIPPRPQGKFIDKKIEISKQLPVITNEREPSTTKEEILLTKIKNLEEQLAQVQAENSNLRLENKHLKALVRQDQETEAKVIQPLPFKGEK